MVCKASWEQMQAHGKSVYSSFLPTEPWEANLQLTTRAHSLSAYLQFYKL